MIRIYKKECRNFLHPCEPGGGTSKTIPGQSFTVDELLRRAQNGTFPDINFHDAGNEIEGKELPDTADFDDRYDFVEAMDIGQASEELVKTNEAIKNVTFKNKPKNKK